MNNEDVSKYIKDVIGRGYSANESKDLAGIKTPEVKKPIKDIKNIQYTQEELRLDKTES